MALRCENTPLYKFIRCIKMEQLFIQQEMIDIISKSHKEFNTNLKQNYEIVKILNNEEIKNTIDITNIYSAEQIINQKINNFAKQSN